jgi:putative restriction endonuclease
LLEAAHIVPDVEKLGEARVPNGISPDGEVFIPEALLRERDGPMLEHGLRGFHRQRLAQPDEPQDRPDRDLLAVRWDRFMRAN